MKFLIRKEEYLDKEWDVIVIGGGPAGYSSALFSSRYGLKTLVITENVGGTLLEANIIENYPGIRKISGKELSIKLKEHAEIFGAKTYIDKVIDIEKDKFFIVKTANEKEFYSKAIILATGSKRKKLNVPGENLKGVSYCAECDAPLYKNKVVAVIGGGNTAFYDASVLLHYAKKVYIIHRKESFSADKIEIERVRKAGAEFLLNRIVEKIEGRGRVEKLILRNLKDGKLEELRVDGIFVAIGLEPSIDLAKKIGLELENNKIRVNECMETSMKGVFACGDIVFRPCKLNLIVSAVHEGALAAFSAYRYIKSLR